MALDGLTEHEIGVKLEEIVKQGSPKRYIRNSCLNLEEDEVL